MNLVTLKEFFIRTPYPGSEEDTHGSSRTVIICSILLFLALFGARSYRNILHPGLYMEDTTHYFNLYYGGQLSLSTILQHPNGYYNVLNNFYAWLVAAKADVRLHALLYHLFAMAMGLTTACIMLFSGHFKKGAILLIAPVVLGLSGMNHIYYFVALTFQMYNVAVLLLCLLLFPPQKTWAGLLVACLLAAILVWSGPYSVVAAPVSLLFLLFFRNGKKDVLLIWVILCCVLYSLALKGGMIRIDNIMDSDLRGIMIDTLVRRVLFLDLFGPMNAVKIIGLLVMLAAFFYIMRHDVFYLKFSVILFAIIIGALAPLFLSIKYLLYQRVFPCHIYLSQFFWLFFLLYSVDKLLGMMHWQPHAAALVVSGLLLLVVGADNMMHREKGYQTLMKNIPRFLTAVHNVEQLNLEEKNEYALLYAQNIVPDKFIALARVGSHRKDAKRVHRSEISIPEGSHFVVH